MSTVVLLISMPINVVFFINSLLEIEQEGLINQLESLIMGLDPEFLSEHLIREVFKS